MATNYKTLRQALRQFWLRYWPARRQALEDAKVKYIGDNKKRRYSWVCNKCGLGFASDEVQVDHITPCGSLLSPEDEQDFIYRLLFGKLQVLCKPCHKAKTKKERK